MKSETLQTALSMTQIIFGGIVLLLILCLLGFGILALCQRIFDKYYARGMQYQFDRDRDHIASAADWFSEDLPTMHLVLDLAKNMGTNTGDVRERWRKERKHAPEKLNQQQGGMI